MASRKEQATRAASFALYVVQRREGLAAIVYRRLVDDRMQERFKKVAALSPLSCTAAGTLLRTALKAAGHAPKLAAGQGYQPLDPDWGARVACFALVARGLRDPRRLSKSAEYFRSADAAEAALWFGRMQGRAATRVIRAVRILTEAVQ